MPGTTVSVILELTRWVSDSPFPGTVEARLVDADGRRWIFIDKHPMFDAKGEVSAKSDVPISVEVPFTVIEERRDRVVVSSAEPAGIESLEGVSVFELLPEQVAATRLDNS